MVRFFRTCCALGVVSLLLPPCHAQQHETPVNDASTLHVYVNRIQIPVLVLSQYGRPIRPVPESSFTVSIDGKNSFRPSHVRLEGDDPLAIAVIVDASNPNETTWRALPKAVEHLLPKLNPQDRLTLYGIDGCKAQRFLPENSALNLTLVRAGVDAAMKMQARAGEAGKTSTCAASLSLADVVLYVAARLANYPGRRMIVTMGAGSEAGYAARMELLKQLLNAESIMLLPLVHDSGYSAMPMPYLPRRIGAVGVVNPGNGSAYGNLAELSEFSGGRVRYIASHEFAGALAEAVTTARGRYILEFPRPDELVAGHYRITVMDGHPRDFIRTSGTSVPVATAEEIAAAKHATFEAGTTAEQEGTTADPAAPSVSEPILKKPPAAQETEPVTSKPVATLPKAPMPLPDSNDITNDLRPNR